MSDAAHGHGPRLTNKGLTGRWQGAMMDNFGTPRIPLVRGEGATVWDADGNEYLDFLGGIAVNALGHAHPAVVRAVSDQVATLGHVSNFFVSEPTVALAERLLALAGRPGRVYFSNSGAEANEAAFKIGRLTGRRHMVSTAAWLPRPDHGRPRPHRPARQAGALRTAARRRRLHPVRGRRGPPRRRHHRHRLRHPGARPGRERRHRPAARLPPGRPRDHRRHRHPAGPRRDPDRHRPDRTLAGVAGAGRRGRHHHPRQGAGRRSADRCDAGLRPGRRAAHARFARLDVQRQPGRLRRLPSRSWTPSRRTASWRTSRGSASG